MTFKLIALITALLLILGLVFAGPAAAFHGIQDTGRGLVSLSRPSGHKADRDGIPEQAMGVAVFRVRPSAEGFYFVTVRIRVSSLPKKAGRVYDAWLVDNETGGSLNLGVFNTDKKGRGQLTVNRTMNNLYQYDRLVITTEDINSLSPRRNGPVVLTGTHS
jgi:hypothetical protein